MNRSTDHSTGTTASNKPFLSIVREALNQFRELESYAPSYAEVLRALEDNYQYLPQDQLTSSEDPRWLFDLTYDLGNVADALRERHPAEGALPSAERVRVAAVALAARALVLAEVAATDVRQLNAASPTGCFEEPPF